MVTDPKIKEKIDKLRNYWFNDQMSLKWVNEVEVAIRKILTKEELFKNKGIKAVVDDIEKKIRAIDTMLTYNAELTDKERGVLFAEKKVHSFYLNRFSGKNLDQQFDRVGKLLDEELEKISN